MPHIESEAATPRRRPAASAGRRRPCIRRSRAAKRTAVASGAERRFRFRYVGSRGGDVAVEITNLTEGHERVEAFIRAKAALIDTTGLSVHIKHTKARGRDVTGYYRFADRRIVLAVKKRLKYPRRAAYGVGSRPVERQRLGSRPYKLVWYEETFTSAADLLIFVAGHEFWHFLCHSGQRGGDYEVRANCHGFMWMSEYKRWPGSPAQVEPIPTRPLRPDLPPPTPAVAPPIAVVARPMAALPRRAPTAPRTPVQGKLF